MNLLCRFAMEALAVQFLLLLLPLSVHSEGASNESACRMYGVGEMSECTTGFASRYHIDEAEGNTALDMKNGHQVVIPDIHFRCNGTIRKWIIGAKWRGNSGAYTELQIWRRSSGSVYTKVGSTTIVVGTENDSQLYEYPLETPLAFQEGDILGYFQPIRGMSELRLYLEDSNRLIIHVDSAETPHNYFDISASNDKDDGKYPLIGIRTDPPGSGCGFMTLRRMYRLLGNTMISTGQAKPYNGGQAIFPDIGFTCSGEVVKWIMGGEWNGEEGYYPQLQVWRPSGNNVYRRLNGSTISATVERNDNVYEFIADPPIPFQPGDILGVFQPRSGMSRLQMDFDNTRGRSTTYHISTGSDEVVPSHSTIDTNDDENLRTTTALPLISVEIVASSITSEFEVLHSSTPASSHTRVVQLSTTTPIDMYSITTSVQVTPTAVLSAVISHSPPHPEYGRGSSDGAGINSLTVGVGVAGALLVLIIAPVIIIAVLVCLRRKNNKLNMVGNAAYQSSSNNLQANTDDIHTSQVYSYPCIATSMDFLCTTPNEVYTDHTSSNEVADVCIPTSVNPAYLGRSVDSTTSNTNILTSTNQAYLEDGPIYEDADIPTSTNQSYLEEGLCQSSSDTYVHYDYI